MYLPPLQPVTSKDVYISGDVTIHPSAALAPGVILQAAPNSKIVIEAEVSIGMGTVINAYQGEVVIANGATLGAGSLVIGTSKIGSNACIGTATTIFNSSVDAMAVIAPGSLIGDVSRQYNINENPNNKPQTPETEKTSSPEKVAEQNGSQAKVQTVLDSEATETAEAELEKEKNSSEVKKNPSSVVGQVYINQLLLTLFPNYQSLNPNSSVNKLE